MITILGLDPGTSNFGYSVVSFRKKGRITEFKIREVGLIEKEKTVQDVNGVFQLQLAPFKREMQFVLKKHKYQSIIAERYTARSFRSNLAEVVPMMLAVLAMLTNIPMRVVQAVTWKAAVKKITSLDDLYKSVHALPHEIDATLLTFYLTDNLPLLKTKKNLDRLKWQLESLTVRPPKKQPKK